MQLRRESGLVSLRSGYRFLELAAKGTGIPDLGVQVAARTSAFSLGLLGEHLKQSTTIRDYIITGARLITSLENRGATLWLTREGDSLRVNQVMAGGTGPGPAIADSYTLVLTINMLRRMTGADWWPGEVGLRTGTDMLLGDWSAEVNGKVLTGLPYSSFTVPNSMLSRRIDTAGLASDSGWQNTEIPASILPDNFLESVQRLVETLILDGHATINSVANAAGMSPRALQRRLMETDTSFTQILTNLRICRAKHWLEKSSMRVADIAAELDYTDASNFSRAFRKETSLSPTAYRRASTQAKRGSGQ